MSRTGTPLRVIGVLAAVVVAGAAAVGMTYLVREAGTHSQGAIPAPPSASPSESTASALSDEPSPSPTPEDLKAKNIAEAKQRLVDYYATTAEVANGGYKDWEDRLLPFWGHPEIWQPLSSRFRQLAESGVYTSGEASVVSIEVRSYLPSETSTEEVGVNACVDFAEVKTFDSAGNQVPRDASIPTRYRFDYTIRHQGPDSVWTINSEAAHPEQPC